MNGQESGHGDDTIVTIQEGVRRQLRGRLEDFVLQHGDGGLILRGRAASYYVKQLAQEAVRTATSTRIVTNAIEVAWSAQGGR